MFGPACANEEEECAHCGVYESKLDRKLLRCSRCLMVKYCSRLVVEVPSPTTAHTQDSPNSQLQLPSDPSAPVNVRSLPGSNTARFASRRLSSYVTPLPRRTTWRARRFAWCVLQSQRPTCLYLAGTSVSAAVAQPGFVMNQATALCAVVISPLPSRCLNEMAPDLALY